MVTHFKDSLRDLGAFAACRSDIKYPLTEAIGKVTCTRCKKTEKFQAKREAILATISIECP